MHYVLSREIKQRLREKQKNKKDKCREAAISKKGSATGNLLQTNI
jgi:hypothetical protein